LHYNILIAGKRLPNEFGELKQWNSEHIFYAGFVEDIDLYSKAADILLNPVNSGGGVKTKMIEALGFNTSVVATETGATGVDKNVCGNKLNIVNDGDWNAFVNSIKTVANAGKTETSAEFYATYNWTSVVTNALKHL
jgi:polysaccharide biosynthesis protein PslH